MAAYAGDGLWLVRLALQRGLAAIYLLALLSALNQFRPLLGERGLEPVPDFVARVPFSRAPSLFHLRYSDRLFVVVALVGIALALAALFGLTDGGPLWVSIASWLFLWAIYLSIVNVGQTFYAFGWESMLVEAGFFAAFLGPTWMAPSAIPILALRWMLFRVELGAGLIKLRNDPCWRDFSCLDYHYETQPLPNPLSWLFHRLPKPLHRFSVGVSHFVQVVAPFGLLAPQPIATVAGALAIVHQLWLIVSGNYAWLNWLTVVLGASALRLPSVSVALAARPAGFEVTEWLLAGATIALSLGPIANFFSPDMAMNRSYNPLHLVGSYGAFGSVTKVRYEVVVEGTEDDVVWREYGFRAKPGDPKRLPPQVAPYHLRLDWLMWFLPFGAVVSGGGVATYGYERWFLAFVARLLDADPPTLALLRDDPFRGRRPTKVRARFYRYRYTRFAEWRANGAFWTRELVGEYLPPLERRDLDETVPVSATRRGRRRSARASSGAAPGSPRAP